MGSVMISLSISPTVIMLGPTTMVTYTGVTKFENLSVDSEGTFQILATADGVYTAYSPFFEINNNYLKLSLSEIPATTIDKFSVTVVVFDDVRLTNILYAGNYLVYIKFESENNLQETLEKSTIDGSVVFDNLIITKDGEYSITALSNDGLFPYIYPSNLLIKLYLCPEGEYILNDICVCIPGAINNILTDKCECPVDQQIKDNTCVCIVDGSTINTITGKCECPEGEYTLDDACVCIPRAEYSTLTDKCECPFDQKIVDNVCVCIIDGSIYNTESLECECPSDQYVLDNTCTCIVEGSTYNALTEKCECPADLYVINNVCSQCTIENSIYDEILQECYCPDHTYLIDNSCVLCVRWLKSKEISASLTNYLKTLLIEFDISIIPINCASIFQNSYISKLGIGYSCYYNDKNTSISISLGYDRSVTNEIITLNSENIKGSTQECGYEISEIKVEIIFIEPFPVPEAIIIVPNMLFYECEDLILDGSLSHAGFKGEVLFNWDATSDIYGFQDMHISFSSENKIILIGSDISDGIIYVKLIVKNDFGKENTTFIQINALKSISLSVEFDETVEYTCLVASTCYFFIQKIKSCLPNTLYTLKWSLAQGQNLLSSESLSIFWSKQNIPSAIILPSNTFPPSTIEFLVIVTDTTTGFNGSQILQVTIISNSPVLILNPLSGSISTTKSTIIDASESYDPNQSGELDFLWYCSYKNSECSFPYDKKQTYFIIPLEFAKDEAIDYINITISILYNSLRRLDDSNFLSTSTQFIPYFTKWPTPQILILEYFTKTQPIIVSAYKPFSLKAVMASDDNFYNPKWYFVDSVGYFLTPTDQFAISIDTRRLNKAVQYQIKFSVTDFSGSLESFFITILV